MKRRLGYFLIFLLVAATPLSNAPNVRAGTSRVSVHPPSAFTATMRDQTAIGGIPSGHRGQAAIPAKELLGLRTQFASVFAQADGTYKEVVSAAPIHYKDSSGAWQNIDSTLAASSRTGYSERNRANSWTVDLPSTLAQPIWLSTPNGSVAFQPVGAAASGVSDGTTETYANAWPGVSLEYRATSSEIKESIVLSSLSAATTPLTFALILPSGESVHTAPSGQIQVLNGSGGLVTTIPAPFMEDANYRNGSAPNSLSLNVQAKLRQNSTGTFVDVVPDQTWLQASGRAWPVTIDPSFSGQPSNDCEIATTTSNALCPPSDVLQVGNYNAILRTLLQFNPWTEWVGTVLNASVNLYLVSGSSESPIELHAVTRSWTNQVNWNTYDGTNSWTNPGGDFNSSAEWTCCSGMTAGNWYSWDFTSLTQKWVQGSTSEFGLILKNANESTQFSVSNFATTTNSNSSLWPYMTFVFSPNLGLTSRYTEQKLQLTDHAFTSTNIGNGNQLVGVHFFGVRGIGLDLSLDAQWNSSYNNSFFDVGRGWSLNTGFDVDIDTWDYPDGAIFHDSTGQYYRFALVGSTYISPPGIDATFTNASGGIYRLTYHATSETLTFNNGWLTKDTDRNGNSLSFLYDSNGALTSITDTEGRVTTFGYSTTGPCGGTASGVITSISDSAGRTYSLNYDFTQCLLVSYIDPQNGSSAPISFTYDGNDNISRVTDNKGNVTNYAYQPSTGNDQGWIASVSRVYDGQGDAYTTTYSDGVVPANLSYAGVQTVTDPNNHQWQYTFDSNNLLTQKKDPLGNTRSLAYNANYDLTQATDGLNQSTTLTYDSNFNLTKLQYPASKSGQTAASVGFAYQAPGQTYLPSSSTDAVGDCGSALYDSAGNLTYSYSGQASPCDGHAGGTSDCDAYQGNPSGTCGATSTVSCSGAKAGELCWAKDGDGHKTSFAYDTNGNVITITPPSPMAAAQSTVDSLSRTTSITDGKGQKTSFSYDQLDRVVQILYGGATSCTSGATCTTFTWDADGNLASRTDVTGTTTFTYDKLNRLVTKSLPDSSTNCSGQAGITSAYDGADNLTQYCDAGGTVSYGYDSANRNISVAEPGGSCSGTVSLCTTLTYDNDGRLTKLTFPGGATQSSTYDNVGNLTSLIGKDDLNHVITNFSYSYAQSTQDANVRLSMTESDPLANLTTTYTYDTLGRLTKAANSQTTLNYGYDSAGNRTSAPNGASTFNGANEITSSPGVSSYGFDADGNLTSSISGGSVTYNAQNQSTAINWGGSNLTGLSYAGLGQSERSAAGSTTYASSMLGLSISKASGSSTDFTRDASGHLIGERTPDGSHWYYLGDAIGSIVAVISASGENVANRYAYDPYGRQTYSSTTVANPWGYAGGYVDSTGLILFGARYYDPNLGRFTQCDPASTLPDYTYAGDNPINFSDPSGLMVGSHIIADGGWTDTPPGGGSASGTTYPTIIRSQPQHPAGTPGHNKGQPQASLVPDLGGKVEFYFYAIYYVGYTVPTPASPVLEAYGLSGDAAVDWREGSSVRDEGKPGHIIPGNRGPIWYLPGVHSNGCIDFWPISQCS